MPSGAQMTPSYIYFIYGLSVMFYSMMAWFFFKKNRETLPRLVGVLMTVLALQCLKDLFFFESGTGWGDRGWMIMTSVDMVSVPLYAFILIELCRPGLLKPSAIAVHELPFVVLPTLFALTDSRVFYYADVSWAAVYGFGYAVWTVVNIPKYHAMLRLRFSYDDNINLNWLRYILMSFFVILSLWILDCLVIDFDIEALYMCGTLVIWMFICYFIYRHESVIDELTDPAVTEGSGNVSCECVEGLEERIRALFEKEHIFLNPQLKLSDVAAMTNSNRTYVSRIFNTNHGKTFFEFVNEYRVNYAKTLLATTSAKLEVIAEQSGFSSRQSFHRVFSKIEGCTPEKFRSSTSV